MSLGTLILFVDPVLTTGGNGEPTAYDVPGPKEAAAGGGRIVAPDDVPCLRSTQCLHHQSNYDFVNLVTDLRFVMAVLIVGSRVFVRTTFVAAPTTARIFPVMGCSVFAAAVTRSLGT